MHNVNRLILITIALTVLIGVFVLLCPFNYKIVEFNQLTSSFKSTKFYYFGLIESKPKYITSDFEKCLKENNVEFETKWEFVQRWNFNFFNHTFNHQTFYLTRVYPFEQNKHVYRAFTKEQLSIYFEFVKNNEIEKIYGILNEDISINQ